VLHKKEQYENWSLRTLMGNNRLFTNLYVVLYMYIYIYILNVLLNYCQHQIFIGIFIRSNCRAKISIMICSSWCHLIPCWVKQNRSGYYVKVFRPTQCRLVIYRTDKIKKYENKNNNLLLQILNLITKANSMALKNEWYISRE